LDAKEAALMAKDQEIGAKDALAAELCASLDQARAEISETRMEIAALAIAAEQADAAARTAEARVAELETAERARRARGLWRRIKDAWLGR
jgi:septal ring factor EnvC (AmiA/AmiB activator)